MPTLKDDQFEMNTKVLRPEVKAALEAAEIGAHDTLNLDGEDDYALASLAFAYKMLGLEDDTKRCSIEAISWVEQNGSLTFPHTLSLLTHNGYLEESQYLVEKWFTSAAGTTDKHKAGILHELMTTSMLLERKDWLSRIEPLLPSDLQGRDSTLHYLSSNWASVREHKKAFATVAKIQSASSRASAWARIACTFAYTKQEKHARYALRNAERYITDLSGKVEIGALRLSNQMEIESENVMFQIIEAYLALGEIEVAQRIVKEAELDDIYLRLYNERLSLRFAEKGRFNEAIEVARKITSTNVLYSDSATQNRLITLASIGLSMAKADHTVDAHLLLTEVWEEVKQHEYCRYAFLRITEVLSESGFTSDALLAYTDLYKAYVNVGKPRDWVNIVAKAIANQVKAGLAYETV